MDDEPLVLRNALCVIVLSNGCKSFRSKVYSTPDRTLVEWFDTTDINEIGNELRDLQVLYPDCTLKIVLD